MTTERACLEKITRPSTIITRGTKFCVENNKKKKQKKTKIHPSTNSLHF